MQLIIVGAGPAGLTVAEGVRRLGVDADVTMLSAEPYPPYAPPAMADYFSTGREATIFWKGKDVCDRLSIDYRSGTRVARLEPDKRTVVLDSGDRLRYDHLVIASGSSLYAPIGGTDLAGVFNFKSLTAATSLITSVKTGEVQSAVIVGAGFIGLEVALLLADLGVEVTIVEMADSVMPAILDPETASIVLDLLLERGAKVRLETKAAGFAGSGRVEQLDLESGQAIAADAYVAATGVKPSIDYLAGSGIDADWGVRVDDHLMTNLPDVVAVGDVAETPDRFTGERYVHAIFPNAVAQGSVAAERLAGFDSVYEGAESMNSLKHLGVPVMAVGARTGSEERRWRGGDTLRKVFIEDGRIVGFRFAGDTSGAGVLRSLMLRKADVSAFADRLAEPSFGIADVAFRVLAS
jgi:NAD(P)H-nitrite reductase large subunit